MADNMFIHAAKLSEQAEIFKQERTNLDNLMTQVKRAKQMADGNTRYQYEKIVAQIEQMIQFMNSMSKAAESTSSDARELSRQIAVMTRDAVIENKKTFSNLFQ